MSDHGVARVNKDQAGGPIGTGAKTVFVENKKIAVVGAVTAKGYSVAKASTTVFAGES